MAESIECKAQRETSFSREKKHEMLRLAAERRKLKHDGKSIIPKHIKRLLDESSDETSSLLHQDGRWTCNKHTQALRVIAGRPDAAKLQHQHIKCLEAINPEIFFTTFTTLTSRRQNGRTARVTEALQHRITHQRYQHDFRLIWFALINRNVPNFLLAKRERKKNPRVGSRKREKVNCEETSREKDFSGLRGGHVGGFFVEDVNATTERAELRENRTRSLFFSCCCKKKGLFSIPLRAAVGQSCGVGAASSSSPFTLQKMFLNETFHSSHSQSKTIRFG